MSNDSTDAPVRATKTPARSKAAPQATPPQPLAEPIAWRQPIRQVLDEIYGSLAELVDPVGKPGPLGLAAELMTHAKEGIGVLLCQENDGPGWCDQIYTLGEVLWSRDSLVAAAKLVEFKAETLPTPVASSLAHLSDQMSAVCVALEEQDLPSLLAKLASAGAKQPYDQTTLPIRREPAAAYAISRNPPGEIHIANREDLERFVSQSSTVLSSLNVCLSHLVGDLGLSGGPDSGFIADFAKHVSDLTYEHENAIAHLLGKAGAA